MGIPFVCSLMRDSLSVYEKHIIGIFYYDEYDTYAQWILSDLGYIVCFLLPTVWIIMLTV